MFDSFVFCVRVLFCLGLFGFVLLLGRWCEKKQNVKLLFVLFGFVRFCSLA